MPPVSVFGQPDDCRNLGSQITISRCSGSTLNGCIIDGSNLEMVTCKTSQFSGVKIHRSTTTASRLTKVSMDSSEVLGSHLTSAWISQSSIAGSQIVDAEIKSSIITGSRITNIPGVSCYVHDCVMNGGLPAESCRITGCDYQAAWYAKSRTMYVLINQFVMIETRNQWVTNRQFVLALESIKPRLCAETSMYSHHRVEGDSQKCFDPWANYCSGKHFGNKMREGRGWIRFKLNWLSHF